MTLSDLYPGFNLECPAINAPIEPGIKPLCDVLNSIPGVVTIWSCEGHPERSHSPYVTFLADESTAFKIHSTIRSDQENLGLHYCWWLVATFRDNGSMQYTLKPNDKRISEGTWYRWCLTRNWSKTMMDADLSRLAVLIAHLIN